MDVSDKEGPRGEPLRLLFMNDHLGHESGEIHGVTSYFLNVLPALQSLDLELVACFLRGRHRAADYLEERGVRPIFLDRSKWDPRALVDLLRIMRRHRIQLVHAAGMKSILLGRIAARLTGAAAIIHFHDTRTPSPLVGFAQRVLNSPGTRAIAVSEAVRSSAANDLGLRPAQVETIYNPLEFKRFAEPPPGSRAELRREFGILDEAHVLGVIGRFTVDKGHPELISALPSILRRHPDTVLLIAGDGSTRRRVTELVEDAGLARNVRFVGHRPDVPRVLAAIDTLVLPSVREGLPYSVMEAMAAGRPVVAFDVGGVGELISHENEGLLVEPGDVEGLSDSVLRVMEDRDLAERLSSAARRKVRSFTLEMHLENLMSAYRRALA